MSPEIENILDFLDGSLPEHRQAELKNWLGDDPDRWDQLARMSFMHAAIGDTLRKDLEVDATIRSEASGQRSESRCDVLLADLARQETSAKAGVISLDAPAQREDPKKPALSIREMATAGGYLFRRASTSKPALLAYAAAVALIAAIILIPRGDNPGQPNQTPTQGPTAERVPAPVYVATLTDVQDARWAGDVPDVGDALATEQKMTLTHGFAEITTVKGAVIILQAPCSFELISDQMLGLEWGSLVGIVESPRAEGLCIRTPHVDVTDLGTRFGVSCDSGTSRLSVYEGRVNVTAVAADPDTPPVTMTAGQSAIVQSEGMMVTATEYNTDRHVTDWQSVVNIPSLTGDIVYEPTIPGDLRVGAYENSDIRIFPERSGVTLIEAITVNVVQPGTYTGEQFQQPARLEPTTVDSYIIHLDTLADEGAGLTHNATVRFNRPVLAILTSVEAVAQTHDTLGLPGVLYGSMSGGDLSRFTGLDRHPEAVSLSEDRMTLTLSMSTATGIDQARVLVQSDTTPTNTDID